MSKKIILLLCMLFYSNGIFTESQQLLTSQEIIIYNEIMKKYEQNKQFSVQTINQFLKEKNVSVQELYIILNKKLSTLDQEYIKLHHIIFTRRWDTKSKLELGLFLSTIGFFIASPIVATGLAIKSYMAPSPMQRIVSSGLIASGAIIASFSPIAYGADFISDQLSNLYERITHKKQNAWIRSQANIDETKKIKNIIEYLKTIFSTQSTYQ